MSTSQKNAGTLVASPATKPSATAAPRRKRTPTSANRIGTNAIQASGHNEKSRKLAAMAKPPTNASTMRATKLRGAGDVASIERAGEGASSTKWGQLRGSGFEQSGDARSNVVEMPCPTDSRSTRPAASPVATG